ncbi:MAG: hypothetical protein IPK97_12670 [Ahniella sp.]|nr:hypothetical protein [Ahniella sp.]
MKWIQSLFAVLLLVVAGTTGVAKAASYTPESGFWWNPNEPGSGLAIEIEDDFIYVAAYLYDPQGFPYWYITSGRLVDSAGTLSLNNAQVATATGGQCLGCPWRAPTNTPAGGLMSIVFDRTDETRATLTWGGQTKTIRRLDYYDIGFGPDAENQRLLGEWQVVLDLFAAGNNYAAYPYYGDVVILDAIDRSGSLTQMIGCRPQTSLALRCTAADDSTHDAAAFYNSINRRSYITVRDQPTTYFTYVADVGVHQFDGVVQIHARNGFNENGVFYPVRGFRSASRSAVQTGLGPAGADKAAPVTARSLKQAILDSNDGVMPKGLTAAEVKARYGFDVSEGAFMVNYTTRLMDERSTAK